MTALKDINTYEEIHQQPDMWRKVYQQLLKDRKKIKYFKENLFRNDALKIIMVGAGSSEFIGQALKPYLSKKINATIDVLGTTDIVLNPETYLKPEDNLLLISFARSGNNPESLATVDYANKIVKNVYHLVITCNPEGELARSIDKKDKNYDLIMPKETLDKGFAMTSSFTTPLLACALFFEFDPTSKTEDINLIIEKGNDMLKQENIISNIAKGDFKRVIYLGSQSLKGIAQESALKLLELTGGNITRVYHYRKI